jgi:hypothetical protein
LKEGSEAIGQARLLRLRCRWLRRGTALGLEARRVPDAHARGPREAPHDRRGRRRARARRTLLGARDDGVAATRTARRGERTGATTRGATRDNTVSSPNRRPCSTPDNGTAPHLAHPVMRHQPAHMSRDTHVDDSRCAPPAEPNPTNSGANNPCPVDSPHSI